MPDPPTPSTPSDLEGLVAAVANRTADRITEEVIAPLLDRLARAEGENERLREAAEEMLLGGAHDGPCTNEEYPQDDACDLHVAASKRRRERLRATLAPSLNFAPLLDRLARAEGVVEAAQRTVDDLVNSEGHCVYCGMHPTVCAEWTTDDGGWGCYLGELRATLAPSPTGEEAEK